MIGAMFRRPEPKEVEPEKPEPAGGVEVEVWGDDHRRGYTMKHYGCRRWQVREDLVLVLFGSSETEPLATYHPRAWRVISRRA